MKDFGEADRGWEGGDWDRINCIVLLNHWENKLLSDGPKHRMSPGATK